MKDLSIGFVAPDFDPRSGGPKQRALSAFLSLLEGWAEVTIYTTASGFRWPKVRSFPVESSIAETGASTKAQSSRSYLSEEERLWLKRSPGSPRLLEQLSKATHRFILLCPWQSPIVFEASLIRPQDSILIPDLRDERFLETSRLRDWLPQLGGLLFTSRAELRLAQRHCSIERVPLRVLGLPMGRSRGGSAPRPHIFSLEDTSASKPRDSTSDAAATRKTVPGEGDFPHSCSWSTKGSPFQIELLECWEEGAPALVDTRLELERELTFESDGGIVFANPAGLERAQRLIDEQPEVGRTLGRQGQAYVRTRLDSSTLRKRCRGFLLGLQRKKMVESLKLILYSPAFLKHDAVSNYLADKCSLLNSWNSTFGIRIQDHIERKDFSRHLLDGPEGSGECDLAIFDYPGYYPLIEGVRGRTSRLTAFDFHGVTPSSLWPDDSLRKSEVEIRLAREADWVLVHSRFLEQELIDGYGVSADRIIRFPYAVDLEAFRPSSRDETLSELYGLEGRSVLLYVGRMAPNKRIDVLVRGMAHLPEDCLLLLVGNLNFPLYAREAENAKRIAEELEVSDRVAFTGSVSDEELRRLYSCADVMVSASLHEGFGIPLIESMACGVPIVGSSSAAIPEVIDQAGRCFVPKDSEDFARQVGVLLEDDSAYFRCQQAGLAQAQQYSLEALHDNFLSALARMLEE